MNRAPLIVLALGAALAIAAVVALWWTAPAEGVGRSGEAPVAWTESGPVTPPSAPVASVPERTRAVPGERRAKPGSDAGRPPLVPGRDIPLPPDRWPERLRPKTREVQTPPVEDTPAVRKEDVRAAIDAVKPLIRQCFLDAAEKNAGDQRVVLKFTIEGQGTSGRFRDGEVERSTIPDPWVQACFLEALTDARFPAPVGGGTVTVTYPFAFSVTTDAGAD